VEVDRACVKAVVSAMYVVARHTPISINVHALTLERDDLFTAYLLELCRLFKVPPRNVILEIVEQQRYRDAERFFANLQRLRREGIQIALDDIGLGYSNYRALIEIRPDFYKIDRYFISDCTDRDNARAAIESILLLAGRLGGRVVAEGVETAADLETVCALGVRFVQGFHLATPAPVEKLNQFTAPMEQEGQGQR